MGALKGLYGVKIVKASASPDEMQASSDDAFCESERFPQTLRWHWEHRPRFLKAFHVHEGDNTILDKASNVMTSLPFIVIGLQLPRKDFTNKLYADSLVGVGLASGLFHLSQGTLRKYLRWGDHSMIAASTILLTRALRGENAMALSLASAALLPFQPFMVSAVNTALMEAEFARRVVRQPHLRKVHALHSASILVGGALFLAEDIYPKTPLLHAGWHLAAAVGVATCNKLLS